MRQAANSSKTFPSSLSVAAAWAQNMATACCVARKRTAAGTLHLAFLGRGHRDWQRDFCRLAAVHQGSAQRAQGLRGVMHLLFQAFYKAKNR